MVCSFIQTFEIVHIANTIVFAFLKVSGSLAWHFQVPSRTLLLCSQFVEQVQQL